MTVTSSEGKSQTLQFHCCMGPAATQSDVLEGCGATQLMDAAMAGYHATVFAYGQTGSGKTHTMFGHEDSNPGSSGAELHDGLTIRCIRHIYDYMGSNTSERVIVRASCLEVYNEGVYDLLQLNSKPLPLKWDPEKGYWVPGLKHVDCATLEKALHVARTGVKHRRTGAHALNHESSRSHAILTLNLELSNPDANSADHGSVRYSKISFVDLAGSERVKDTGAAGGTLKEANSINKSLFTLGKVISALSEPVRYTFDPQNGCIRRSSTSWWFQAARLCAAAVRCTTSNTMGMQGESANVHVSYRDSKLTKLLMDSIGGSALCLMVACVSPASTHSDETLNTLMYATRAKRITNKPKLQMDPHLAMVTSMKQEIELLRNENEYLRSLVVCIPTLQLELSNLSL